MMTRIVTSLFCSVAPFALMAQQVDLRSPDEFISVEGEITGYNGVMLRVQTSVGTVSVPASEVICYGEGCLATIESNDFGLTAAAFQDVVAGEVQVLEAGNDTLSVGFASSDVGTLYRTVAGAFAVTAQSTANVDVTGAGEIVMERAEDNQSATLTLASGDAPADITIQTVALNGTSDVVYDVPSEWANTPQPTHQLMGLKSFSVVVAPNADISEITLNDLARVFAGELTNWSQLGGADVNILPLQMPPNNAMSQEIIDLVMAPAGKTIAGNVLTMSDEAGIVASINQFPGSVSVVNTALADPAVSVAVSGACGIPVAPTNFNIVSGDYPLVRPVMANYATTPNTSLVAEVFDFASSDVAQGLIEREGFLSHSAILQDATEKNNRLSGLLDADLDVAQRRVAGQMFQSLFDADRMSPTLTGGPASGPEGGWNRAMLLDVLAAASDPANAGREIIFVGFGESTAGSEAAIAASSAAASQIEAMFEDIAAAQLAAGEISVSSFGFGNVSPAACIDGQVAGSEYTRVEVWIR